MKEFDALQTLIEAQSGVVVAMTAAIARSLFDDPKQLYANYEQLVGAKIRKPADPERDRHRCGVGGVLFGSYARSITYGTLSLTEIGLPTYGVVHCRLRSVTIDQRTSFLETNSYKFVTEHSVVPGNSLPLGYRACWQQRHALVLAKLGDRLSVGQTESEWEAILVRSDGKDRGNDDFVEAHIYEGFDRNAVESMVGSTNRKLTKEETIDLRVALDEFNRLKGKTR